MADPYYREGRGTMQRYDQHQSGSQWSYQAAKYATAATAGGSLLVLSGLTLAATVIALTVATPLLVIFSPVLVPALITVFLLATGFLTSGGFGVAAMTVLSWMYKYATGGHPTGADSLDQAAYKMGSKGRDIRDRMEHAGGGGNHAAGGGHYST
ncbi:hypothetical protein L2E82_31874 [Cichorium intybus]|uniref:Uncharacterized protein n=1 Tax=Cichorium intybus TaxID=13427 RepID=A0ACB9BF54_CICIN|nr:hypothetical protein L1887_08820 [Cichorium endivia]KAI3720876.1 hypothetical protein L2E82_31874 [Cichorium intybus]